MNGLPEKQTSPILVVSASPDIGSGNTTESKALIQTFQNALNDDAEQQSQFQVAPAYIFASPLVDLAQWRHGQISKAAKTSIEYANNQERNSLPAQALKIDMANTVMRHIRDLLKKHNLLPTKALPKKPTVALISAQNMTVEKIAERKPDKQMLLALFLVCPDVFGKFDPQNVDINQKIVHLFWNIEAYDAALKTLPAEKVKLISPLDPLEAFPDKPGRALAEGGKPIIKLSGTGSDPDVVKKIADKLTSFELAPTVVCEMADKLKPYSKQNIATESDPGWYYHSLGEANPEMPPYLICYPSEQVKHLIVLQQKGIFIPTVFLYPKGLHEVRNLAWALKQGLSKVICVPKTLPKLTNPQAEVAKLLAAEGVDASQYQMVDPSELTQEHFQKPAKAWEKPPKAQSLFDTVRGVLSGDCVVKPG